MPYHVFSDVKIDDEVEKAAHELAWELKKELEHISRKFPNMKEMDEKALIEAISKALPVEARKIVNSKYF